MPRPGRSPTVRILHLDPDLIAVDKPPGVLAAPGRGSAPSVADLLRDQPELADNPALRIVHRLDVDASGVQLYARTLPAQRQLVRQFSDRLVDKTYLALVTGYVTQDGEVDLPLRFDSRGERARPDRRSGRPALTRYRIAERVAGNTLLECHPVTGRRHQIRAHLTAIGHPLTVDPLYGGGLEVLLSYYKPDYRPSARHPELPLIARLTLHAARITFEHPGSGEPMTVAAPLPKDLRATVSQLRRLL